ncbi:hypothetical protein MRF4_19875 [Methylobacterium radiotolerans]
MLRSAGEGAGSARERRRGGASIKLRLETPASMVRVYQENNLRVGTGLCATRLCPAADRAAGAGRGVEAVTAGVDRHELRQIIAGLSEGVILVEPDQTIAYANAAALAMHGAESLDELGPTVEAYRDRFCLRWCAYTRKITYVWEPACAQPVCAPLPIGQRARDGVWKL